MMMQMTKTPKTKNPRNLSPCRSRHRRHGAAVDRGVRRHRHGAAVAHAAGRRHRPVAGGDAGPVVLQFLSPNEPDARTHVWTLRQDAQTHG